jgi:hypothetical protein
LTLMMALIVACGPGDSADGDGGAGNGDGSTGFDADSQCPANKVCADTCCGPDSMCIDGACCPDDDVCGGVCCEGGTTCQAGICRLDCGATLPCGEVGSEVCCGSMEVCYDDACTVPGEDCDDIYDCGGMAYCEPTIGQCLPLPDDGITCLPPPPPIGVFTPVIGWTWQGSTVAPGWNQVMMTPAIANLTDDNNDMLIDENDVPDVLFNTFTGSNYGADGILRVVSGDTGAEILNITDLAFRTVPGSSIAVGDIDMDGFPEIVACGTQSGNLHPVIVFEHDGSLKWISTDPAIVCGYSGPSIANIDQIGPPEIIVRYAVVNADGSLRWRGRAADGLNSIANFTAVYDIDDDGFLDVVGGNVAYDRLGNEIWSRDDHPDGYLAIGDLDGINGPDVLMVNPSTHYLMAFRGDDGTDLWAATQDVNQGVPTPSGPNGGGPPTIADFDGDGLPEVAVAGGYGYVIFEGEDGTPKWFRQTIDLSSRVTGSSVFDFEDDGVAEVLYADERELHIYSGTDGTPLLTLCNSSGTLWEYPLVADVDNDERAEIIVARNNYAFGTCLDNTPAQTGIAMIEDSLDNWVRTRRIWNQHTYHVTNVNEDGTIPPIEADNWEIFGLNNFRQNVQPIAVPAAPDLIVESIGASIGECPTTITVEAWVKNIGDAGAPAGVPVSFYEGDLPTPTYIGLVPTGAPLLPGESDLVAIGWPVPIERLGESISFYAAIDDDGTGMGPGEGMSIVVECDDINNVSPQTLGMCTTIE